MSDEYRQLKHDIAKIIDYAYVGTDDELSLRSLDCADKIMFRVLKMIERIDKK